MSKVKRVYRVEIRSYAAKIVEVEAVDENEAIDIAIEDYGDFPDYEYEGEVISSWEEDE